MNYKLVYQIIGRLCALLGCLLLAVAAFAALSDADGPGEAWAFAGSAGIALVLFLTSLRVQPTSDRVRAPEGFACVTVGWVLVGLLGALPFRFSGAIPSYTDAFFEAVSGFTTTGASILRDIEALPPSILLWRSLTQWLGGMGIVALFVALLPALGAGGNFLFQAEVPGPTPGRIKPRISQTAKTLWIIYLGLTLAEVGLLLLFGMSLFEAINHAFTTLSTGGFSTSNTSIAGYGGAIQWTITVFMFLGGVNFAMHFLLLHRDWKSVLRNEEVRLYGLLGLGAIVLVALFLALGEPARPPAPGEAADIAQPDGLEATVRHAAFQVVSMMTTTGFATHDFDRWPHLCRMLLVFLMFFGACAGSTAGGMKLARVMVLWRYILCQVRKVLHPSAVLPVKIGRRIVDTNIVDQTVGFFVLFMGLYAAGSLVMLLLGVESTTALTAAIACLSNIGPGLGEVGPAQNYADLPAFGKWFLTLLMLLGRLEIYAVVLLFVPSLWQK